jgi:hypothetical protein
MVEGIRLYPNKYGFLRLPEGGYGKDMNGRWWCRPPGAHMQDLRHHKVEEHLDGGITVAPQIETGNGAGSFTLEQGIWRRL